MKKFKFEKPFVSLRHNMESTKENWRIALHDPAFLFLLGLIISLIALLIFIIF